MSSPYQQFLQESQTPTELGDQAHAWSDAERRAVAGAWACSRPLLICGEPGTGKTQLAHATAKLLGVRCFSAFIHARFEPSDLLYRFDAVRRLAEAQIVAARYAPLLVNAAADPDTTLLLRRQMDGELAAETFQEPGVIWQAMVAPAPQDSAGALRDPIWPRAVVLIDEIDKADAEVPNRLLEVLAQRSFTPRFGTRVHCEGHAPLVMITSNGERTLPAAFLRRCVVLRMQPQADTPAAFAQWLIERAKVHPRLKALFEQAPNLAQRAAEQVWRDREQLKDHGRVGLAEYLDLLQAVVELGRGDWQRAAEWLEELHPFLLRKHAPDGDSALSGPDRGSA